MGALLLMIFTGSCDKTEVPIVRSIGISPISDVTTTRGSCVRRELIYLNKDSDPGFYKKIVSAVEKSGTIIEWHCRKTSGRDMHGSTLKANGLSESDVSESITFRTADGRFNCTVSNGGSFVLVIIYTT
jgi:hypothetical protein